MIDLPEGVELVRTRHVGDETILEYEDNLPELIFLFELFEQAGIPVEHSVERPSTFQEVGHYHLLHIARVE
jgi:hypothetical protein